MNQAKQPTIVAAAVDIDCAEPGFRELTLDWHQVRGIYRNLPLVRDMLKHPDLPRRAWLALWRVTPGPIDLLPEMADRVSLVARLPEAVPAGLPASLSHGYPQLHEIRIGRIPGPMRYRRLSLPLSDDGAEADWLLTFGLPANPDLAIWEGHPGDDHRQAA